MCGICGTYGLSDRPLIRSMCEVMVHRGPDHEGVYLDREGRIALGVRRLSIIDLETGNQPIHNEDGSVWLVLNGEIYNYRSLRTELEGKGHSFYTKSDTETIIHLYEDFGEDCLAKLNGMFAFAIWDEKKNKLLIARDRLGIKPLYYSYQEGRFAFASEIKALLRSPFLRKEVDLKALDAYLTFGYVPAPRTILKGVKKLLPGHLLSIGKDGLSTQRYWEPDLSPNLNLTEGEWLEGLEELLKDSISLMLVSDVPLGALLSGGIDSSTVVGLMSRVSSRVKTFSIGFEGAHDETKYARTVAQHFGTDHQELFVQPQAAELLGDLVWYLDEPVADQAALPTYLICQLAKSGVTVVLTGEGGDEQFGGYPRYLLNTVSDSYQRLPKGLRAGLLRFGERIPLPDGFGRALRKLTYAERDPIRRNIDWVSNFSPQEKEMLYSPELKGALKGVDLLSLISSWLEELEGSDPLNSLMHLDLRTWLVDDILTKVDRMSMANSLEARVPFLDHRVVELSAKIPASLKLKRFKTKYLLKRMASDLLPREIVRRRKQAFLVPTNLWFQKELREFVQGILSDTRFEKRGYFDQSYVRGILQEQLDGTEDNSQKLWNLIVLECWHRQFVDR